MIFFLVAHTCSILLDLIWVARRTEIDKDVEILLLRQQLRILQRKQSRSPRISRSEKLTLVLFVSKLTELSTSARAQLSQLVLLFKPDTVLKWHRELVRHKWTFRKGVRRGRPAISSELEALILRLARENPNWGYGKLVGELGKLGYAIGRSTIRDVLKRQHVPPAPKRSQHGSTWRIFLAHYKDQIVACDFFTVETAWLKTFYVLFFIELGSRRVHLAGCTTNPTSAWVTQQARHMSWQMQGGGLPMSFLIHDRDSKFPAAFDTRMVRKFGMIVFKRSLLLLGYLPLNDFFRHYRTFRTVRAQHPRATTFQDRVAIMERATMGQADPEIARALGCSVWTVRKWRRISQQHGHVGLTSTYGRPRTGPLGTMVPQVRAAILTLRHTHPGWGPATLLDELRHDPCWREQPLPSRSRIAALRKHAKLTRRYEHHSDLPTSTPMPNGTPHDQWELDAHGAMQVEGVGKVALITIVDVVSRVKVESYPCINTTNPPLERHDFMKLWLRTTGTIFWNSTTRWISLRCTPTGTMWTSACCLTNMCSA
jgi:transposase